MPKWRYNTYPLTVKPRNFFVAVIVIIWIVDVRTKFYPCHNKNPGGFKVGKFSAFIVLSDMLRGHVQHISGLDAVLHGLFVHLIIHL